MVIASEKERERKRQGDGNMIAALLKEIEVWGWHLKHSATDRERQARALIVNDSLSLSHALHVMA